jgi:cytochrome c oxidase cbb3-type subunit 1
MASMVPYYGLRLIAGLIFLSGTILMAYNFYMTLKGRETVIVKPPLVDSAYRV